MWKLIVKYYVTWSNITSIKLANRSGGGKGKKGYVRGGATVNGVVYSGQAFEISL
jgi:hypothetical protein